MARAGAGDNGSGRWLCKAPGRRSPGRLGAAAAGLFVMPVERTISGSGRQGKSGYYLMFSEAHGVNVRAGASAAGRGKLRPVLTGLKDAV